jgi:hypothetical protein
MPHTLLGLLLQGANARQRAVLLSEPMPSCRYFQALSSSEEQETTRSSDFRALIPLTHRYDMPKQIMPAPSWSYAPPECSAGGALPLAETTLSHLHLKNS